MSSFEERARLPEMSNEREQLYYWTKPHSTGYGELYEERCAALLLLRCLREGLRFRLSSNDASGGSFDDLVLRWGHEGSGGESALFVQLKHKTSAVQTTVDRAALMGLKESKSFSIKKYCRSYEEIREASDAGSCVLVLYTNIGLNRDAEHMFVRRDPESVPQMRLLQTSGCCYALKPDDEDVKRVVGRCGDQFVRNFYLLCNQSDSETIMTYIRTELRELLGADGESCAAKCDTLCGNLRAWRNNQIDCNVGNDRRIQNVYLTNNWDVWLDMVDSYIEREVTSCNSLVTRVKYSRVDALRAHLEVSNPAWVRPPGQGATVLSTTRVHQAVCGERHIVVSAARFDELRDTILRCWGRFCRWLVLVDDAEHSYKVLQQAGQLAGPSRRLVIVSYERVDSLQDTCKSVDIDDQCWKELTGVAIKLNSEQHVCCLGDLCDTEALKAMLDGKPEALLALSQVSGPVRMGQGLGPLPENHIPRQLTSRMRVKQEFFSSLGDNEVCITDEESYKLLIDKPVLTNSAKFGKLEECLSSSGVVGPRFVVTNDIDLHAVQLICRIYPDMIVYVLNCALDEWEIRLIHRGSEKIRPYVDEQPRSLLRVVDAPSNRAVVEGKPGVGKSTLLLDMAQQLKGQHNSWWILKVDLLKYSEVFDKCDNGVSASKEILLQVVHSKGSLGELEHSLLRHCLLKYSRVICMVDGFDEVCPDYADKCLQALQELAPRRGKLLVTTRPSVTGRLEEALGVLAHSLPPFSKDQLDHYHRRSRPVINVSDVVADLLKIPLFSRIYAESLEGQDKVDDVVSLYETFFARKFRRLYEERWGENMSYAGKKEEINSKRSEHEEQLKFFAVSHLLPWLKVPGLPKSSSIDKDGLVRSGIIYKFIADRPVFIHRTFAEYFLAKWCFSNCAEDVRGNVYHKALSDSSLEFFVESFDRMASRDRPLLTAVLNGSESEVESLLEKGEHPAERDAMGRNSLHLAAVYSRDSAILRLLRDRLEVSRVQRSTEVTWEAEVESGGEAVGTTESKEAASDSRIVEASEAAGALGAVEMAAAAIDPLQSVEAMSSVDVALGMEDGLLKWPPLRYAAERRRWRAVADLLEMGAQLQHLGDFQRGLHSREAIWNIFDKHGYFALADHIHHRNKSMWSSGSEDKRSVEIEVGVTLICAEMSLEEYEAISEEAKRSGLFEVVKLVQRKVVDLMTRRVYIGEDGEAALHGAALGGSASQQPAVTGDDLLTWRDKNGRTLLHYAARVGDVERVRQLIQAGAGVNTQDSNGISALHMAASAGNIDCIKELLGAGAGVNMKHKGWATPLMFAAMAGRHQCVELLLAAGADARVKDSRGSTPLHDAATSWNAKCVGLLIPKVKNLESINRQGRTALHHAAHTGDEQSVKLLLKAGAHISPEDFKNNTPLHLAAGSGNTGCVRQLLRAKAGVGVQNKHGRTALHLAAINGNAECVRLLWKAGVTTPDKLGLTPLHCAAQSGSAESIKILLEKGASVGEKDEDGNTALHHAASSRNAAAVASLAEAAADLNATNIFGHTPLLCAVSKGNESCVGLLLRPGADLQAKDRDDNTLLHCAAKAGSVEMVRLLIRRGAAVEARNSSQETALHIAADGGHHHSEAVGSDRGSGVRQLRHCSACATEPMKSGADVGARTARGEAGSLHRTVVSGNVECVQVLLEAKPKLDVQDSRGLTPLHRAIKTKNQPIIELLLKAGANVHVHNGKGFTPLHYVVLKEPSSCQYVLELLDPASTNFDVAGHAGQTPLQLAARAGSACCVRQLLGCGASVATQDSRGRTALHLAAAEGNAECVRLLLQAGANVHLQDRHGHTALQLAVKRRHDACAGLLRRACDS